MDSNLPFPIVSLAHYHPHPFFFLFISLRCIYWSILQEEACGIMGRSAVGTSPIVKRAAVSSTVISLSVTYIASAPIP